MPMKVVPKQSQPNGCGVIIAVLCGCFMLTVMCNRDGGNSRTAETSTDRKITAWVMAKQFVEDSLKSPGSASFGSIFGDYQDPDHVVTEMGNGEYRVRAWVEAQNSFGATIRTPFVCELEDTGSGTWQCTKLQL